MAPAATKSEKLQIGSNQKNINLRTFLPAAASKHTKTKTHISSSMIYTVTASSKSCTNQQVIALHQSGPEVYQWRAGFMNSGRQMAKGGMNWS